MKVRLGIAAALLVLVGVVWAAPASAKGRHVYKVCKHGCKYSSVQKAVDKVKKGKKSTVKIMPGTYHEGVILRGHKYNKLIITGTTKPKKTILDGKNARIQGQPAQNGIDATNVDGLKIKKLWARNYPANGFFVHADPGDHCHGFAMTKDWASFNGSYGLFAKHCTGGKITHSKGWGHGDSAIYIGETPPQKKNPKWTDISDNKAYENVLGYSGTNSKYVDIHDNMFYNNGAGVVPNTLDSEMFQPNANGKIHDNEIFWNNFNYFLPRSPVKTVSGGLGHIGNLTINYPTGVGVILFGSDHWVVKNNDIFGNFMWGAASFSDGLTQGTKALNMNNRLVDNTMGRGGKDTNRFDFFNDGSMQGNCFEGNTSSTFDLTQAQHPQAFIYPSCPAPANAGTGTYQGDSGQVQELAAYVVSTPPCSQEDQWARHSHPKFKGITPIDTKNFGKCKASSQ